MILIVLKLIMTIVLMRTIMSKTRDRFAELFGLLHLESPQRNQRVSRVGILRTPASWNEEEDNGIHYNETMKLWLKRKRGKPSGVWSGESSNGGAARKLIMTEREKIMRKLFFSDNWSWSNWCFVERPARKTAWGDDPTRTASTASLLQVFIVFF